MIQFHSIFPYLGINSIEQWKKSRGCLGSIGDWKATQLCGDYFINHSKDPVIKQPVCQYHGKSAKSLALFGFFRGSRGSIVMSTFPPFGGFPRSYGQGWSWLPKNPPHGQGSLPWGELDRPTPKNRVGWMVNDICLNRRVLGFPKSSVTWDPMTLKGSMRWQRVPRVAFSRSRIDV